MDEFVGPELERFARNLGGTPSISVDSSLDQVPAPDLTDSDDMRRVDLACHPETPVKVADGHPGAVHCFVCGTPA
jgi:hypothetical protein